MIPLIKPDIAFDEVADDIRAILESGWLTSGRYVRDFEHSFADYIGVKYALATTSATTAMHLALAARGIGEGDEVLVSDYTFPASGNVIVQTGATPVLVDCLPGRFDIDLESAKSKISSRTKAIMVVHPFGQPVDSEELGRFKVDTGLWILEDAACAVAARAGSTRCGAMGDAGAFSFHPRKILTTGEGGMIVTDDDKLYEQMTILRSHGSVTKTSGMRFIENGFNYRMSEIQAALGLVQLRRIEEIVASRRQIAVHYLKQLGGADFIEVPLSAGKNECSFQSFVVSLANGHDRDQIALGLRQRGIETTIGTYAMHDHPSFSRFGYRTGDMPNSLRAQNQSLTLPLYRGLSQENISQITEALVEVATESIG